MRCRVPLRWRVQLRYDGSECDYGASRPDARAAEIIVRPDAPPPSPNAVDSPDLYFLKKGPLTAILQRPMSYRIGKTRDSITVPAGFVAEFASIPRALWSELSPVGEHKRRRSSTTICTGSSRVNGKRRTIS